MRRFFLHWLVVTVSLAVTAYLLPGVKVETLPALLLGGLALGFVNAVIRPIFSFLTFPLTLASLGLFMLVVNGAAFALATWFVPGLAVENLWWAIGASIVVSIVSWLLARIGSSGGRSGGASESGAR